MARKNWGDARAEVLALMPEIRKLISAGVKHVKIYELMQAEHDLTCTFRTFGHWLRKYSDGEIPVSDQSVSPPISENSPISTDTPEPTSAAKPALKLADPSRRPDERKQATDVDLSSKIVRAETPEFKLRG